MNEMCFVLIKCKIKYYGVNIVKFNESNNIGTLLYKVVSYFASAITENLITRTPEEYFLFYFFLTKERKFYCVFTFYSHLQINSNRILNINKT